jgi:hypothetical protein
MDDIFKEPMTTFSNRNMKKENVDVVFRSTLTNQHYYPTGY